jgi:hypothetical protein
MVRDVVESQGVYNGADFKELGAKTRLSQQTMTKERFDKPHRITTRCNLCQQFFRFPCEDALYDTNHNRLTPVGC